MEEVGVESELLKWLEEEALAVEEKYGEAIQHVGERFSDKPSWLNEGWLLAPLMRDIREHPVLSREEERIVISQLKNPARREWAREKLVLHNLRFVIRVAMGYAAYSRSLTVMDYIQVGAMGLWHAADLFDPERDLRFITYAGWWVRESMSRLKYDEDRTIRMPAHFLERVNKIERVESELRQDGEEPSLEKIAEMADLTIDDVACAKLNFWFAKVFSIDDRKAELNGKMNGPHLKPPAHMEPWWMKVLDNTVLTPDLVVMAKEEMRFSVEVLKPIFLWLSQHRNRNTTIFSLRYGLDGDLEGRTLEEIGTYYGLSRERIRQIESRVWRDLHADGIILDVLTMEEHLTRIDQLERLTGIACHLENMIPELRYKPDRDLTAQSDPWASGKGGRRFVPRSGVFGPPGFFPMSRPMQEIKKKLSRRTVKAVEQKLKAADPQDAFLFEAYCGLNREYPTGMSISELAHRFNLNKWATLQSVNRVWDMLAEAGVINDLNDFKRAVEEVRGEEDHL